MGDQAAQRPRVGCHPELPVLSANRVHRLPEVRTLCPSASFAQATDVRAFAMQAREVPLPVQSYVRAQLRGEARREAARHGPRGACASPLRLAAPPPDACTAAHRAAGARAGAEAAEAAAEAAARPSRQAALTKRSSRLCAAPAARRWASLIQTRCTTSSTWWPPTHESNNTPSLDTAFTACQSSSRRPPAGCCAAARSAAATSSRSSLSSA